MTYEDFKRLEAERADTNPWHPFVSDRMATQIHEEYIAYLRCQERLEQRK